MNLPTTTMGQCAVVLLALLFVQGSAFSQSQMAELAKRRAAKQPRKKKTCCGTMPPSTFTRALRPWSSINLRQIQRIVSPSMFLNLVSDVHPFQDNSKGHATSSTALLVWPRARALLDATHRIGVAHEQPC